MRIFFTILSVVAAVCSLQAANVKIQGLVTDERNEPLEFATVRVGGTAVATTTGLDGKYTLTVAEADTIRLLFTYIGYEDSRRRLIQPKGDVTVNVKMTPASYVLGDLEVTDFQKQMNQLQKLDGSKLKLSPDVSGGSVEALLTTMAGVNSTNEMSSQYSVRGGSYDENIVYINGIEVYRPQLISSGQQEGLSIINPDMVGSIGFSTGGFSARYGDRMSSALDITYRQPEAFEGSVSASLMGASVAIGSASKRFNQLHGFRYKTNSSLLSSLDDKGEYDPNFLDYQTSLNFQATSRLKFSFLGNISINNYKFIPHNRQTNFGTSTDAKQFTVYFDGQEKDRFETWFGAFTAGYQLNKSTDFSLMASGYLTNELVSYDISGEYWLDQAGTSGSSPGSSGAVGGELGVGKYLEHARNRLKASVFSLAFQGNTGIKRHNLSYGLQYNHEAINDRSREWELRDSAGYSLPHDPSTVRVIYNLDSHNDIASNRLSAFVMDNFRISTSAGYLNVNAGVRLSYWDYNKEFLCSPRASIGFVPDKMPRWAFRFATGLYYQAPFFKEYRMPVEDEAGNTVIELNDNIKSQRSYQLILGSDYTFRAFGRPFKVTGEAYYKLLGNLIPYEVDNLKIVYTGQNQTNGYTTGLDLKLFGQFVTGTDSWISFSLMKTSEKLNGVNVPRPTDQRYSLAVYFTDFFPKFPRLKFNLRGIFSDGLPTTAPRGSRDKGYFRAPAYKRLDIGLAYGFITPERPGPTTGFFSHFKNIWLGLDVFNLLDISNVSSYYWVTDVNDIQYAVPNYLTRRQFNIRLSLEF